MILGDGDTYVALVKRGGGVGDNGIQRFVIIPGANAGKRLRNALGDGGQLLIKRANACFTRQIWVVTKAVAQRIV